MRTAFLWPEIKRCEEDLKYVRFINSEKKDALSSPRV